jgi:hypothetical protein
VTGGIARPAKVTRARSLPVLPTRQAGERTLLGFLRRAARLHFAAHDQNLMTLGVDDLRAPVPAQPQPEVEATAQPLDERHLAIAVEVPQRRRHLAFPREIHGTQRGEEEEGDREDEDEGQQDPVPLQDSTR